MIFNAIHLCYFYVMWQYYVILESTGISLYTTLHRIYMNVKSNSTRNIWYFICYLKYVTTPAIRMMYVHKLYLK